MTHGSQEESSSKEKDRKKEVTTICSFCALAFARAFFIQEKC